MKRRPLFACLAVLIVAAAALLLHRSVGWADFDGSVSELELDLAHPDALVRTQSLAQLPRDFLAIPIAKDLFTEDLVFYYEEDPDRLGLAGSLRRIAYEHDLRWSDEALAWVLDQPAEIALWRAGDGRLRHWLMALSRPALVRLLHEAATVAVSDRQISRAAELDLDGEPVAVLALEVATSRTWLLAARGERVVVLSHPGMLLDEQGRVRPERQEVLAGLLSDTTHRRAVFEQAFRLPARTSRHSAAVRTHYLSFGYQRFFPGLEALRFDFGEQGWSTHTLFDTQQLATGALSDRALWNALPADPAACALLPVDWRLAREFMPEAAPQATRDALLQALAGPAAVCWYPRARLQAPLVVATLKAARTDLDPALAALFGWAVRRVGEAPAPAGKRRAGDAVVWQRSVQVPFARLNADGEPEPGPMTVTLARHGRHLLFSPDATRVEHALLALDKRYPSVADSLTGEGTTLGLLEPASLADLLREEAMVMLPRGAEPVFRGAAERLLLPRLAAAGRYPPYRLTLPEGTPRASGWQAVGWQELDR